MPDEMLPQEDVKITPAVRKFLMLYFNLCSEEYYMHSNDEIPEEVWKNWEDGMRKTTEPEIYKTGWKLLSIYYNDEFIWFMNQEIFKEN